MIALIYLIESGLRHRVVLYVELIFVSKNHLKDPCQGGGRDLVLQGVVVFFSLDAARKGALHECFSRIQVWGAVGLSCPDLHSQHVSIPKPTVCLFCNG